MATGTPTHELGTFVEMIGDTPVFRLRPSVASSRSWFFAEVDGRHVVRSDYEALRAAIADHSDDGGAKTSGLSTAIEQA